MLTAHWAYGWNNDKIGAGEMTLCSTSRDGGLAACTTAKFLTIVFYAVSTESQSCVELP